jgi:hypothetical protein
MAVMMGIDRLSLHFMVCAALVFVGVFLVVKGKR